MSDVADAMLDGTLCQFCGVCVIKPNKEPPGHPVSCRDCAKEAKRDRQNKTKKRG